MDTAVTVCHFILVATVKVSTKQTDIVAELQQPEGSPSGAPYSCRKEKETHELFTRGYHG